MTHDPRTATQPAPDCECGWRKMQKVGKGKYRRCNVCTGRSPVPKYQLEITFSASGQLPCDRCGFEPQSPKQITIRREWGSDLVLCLNCTAIRDDN